jgi:hypothetical protein
MQNFQAISASNEWHIYVALNAAVGSAGNDEGRLRIAAALKHSEMTFNDRMSDFYADMLQALGLELREGYTVRHVAMAGAAVVEGLALRCLLNNAVEQAQRPPLVPDHGWAFASVLGEPVPAPEGADPDQAWSLPAVAFLGVLDIMTQPTARES